MSDNAQQTKVNQGALRITLVKTFSSTVPGLKFVGQDVLGFNMWAPDTGAKIGYSASLEFQREYRRTKKERQVSHFTHCLSVPEFINFGKKSQTSLSKSGKTNFRQMNLCGLARYLAKFRDTRGANYAQDAPALASFGIPYPNIASLELLYTVLTGKPAGKDELEFQEFVNWTVQSEIIQTVGRLRTQHSNELLLHPGKVWYLLPVVGWLTADRKVRLED